MDILTKEVTNELDRLAIEILTWNNYEELLPVEYLEPKFETFRVNGERSWDLPSDMTPSAVASFARMVNSDETFELYQRPIIKYLNEQIELIRVPQDQ